jgi:exodeoxyribonuclease-5
MKKKKNEILHLGVNEMMLATGKVIKFNSEQIDGLSKIRAWLKNGQTFFTLAGFAGTGKSTIVKKILDEYHGDVVVSGPTHKSKKVIMNMTDRDGQTLHSLLGLRPDVDLDSFNPNDPEFAPIAEPKILNYNWVIIDEASMINLDLYLKIFSLCKDTGIKILYMGDPAQLPPIGERESAVFNQITNEFHQLTIIERQNEGNPLSIIYDALRRNLNTPDGGFIRKSATNKYGEGIIFTEDKAEFRKRILERFRNPEFQNTTDYAKVIAWKNKTVMSANKVIRTALFGDDTDIVEVGDILMAYRSVRSSNARYNIIENSADYRIISKMDLSKNKYGILGYVVRLQEDLPHGKFKHKDVFIVDSSNHDNLHDYAELHDKFKKIGKDKKEIGSWTEYYSFRRQNILMKTINKHRDGTARSKYDIIVKDMDYGFALTCHKAQGSTYTHVFVMENDIDENWLVKERNQLKYTSLTRPTTSATVLINSEEYGTN